MKFEITNWRQLMEFVKANNVEGCRPGPSSAYSVVGIREQIAAFLETQPDAKVVKVFLIATKKPPIDEQNKQAVGFSVVAFNAEINVLP